MGQGQGICPWGQWLRPRVCRSGRRCRAVPPPCPAAAAARTLATSLLRPGPVAARGQRLCARPAARNGDGAGLGLVQLGRGHLALCPRVPTSPLPGPRAQGTCSVSLGRTGGCRPHLSRSGREAQPSSPSLPGAGTAAWSGSCRQHRASRKPWTPSRSGSVPQSGSWPSSGVPMAASVACRKPTSKPRSGQAWTQRARARREPQIWARGGLGRGEQPLPQDPPSQALCEEIRARLAELEGVLESGQRVLQMVTGERGVAPRGGPQPQGSGVGVCGVPAAVPVRAEPQDGAGLEGGRWRCPQMSRVRCAHVVLGPCGRGGPQGRDSRRWEGEAQSSALGCPAPRHVPGRWQWGHPMVLGVLGVLHAPLGCH